MLESKIERATIKWATQRGWVTYKLGGLGDKGKADRIFFHRCCVVIMEFKRSKGGKLAELQQWHARRLNYVGHITYFPNSIESAIHTLEQVYEHYNGGTLEPKTIPGKSDTTNVESSGSGVIFGPWIRKN